MTLLQLTYRCLGAATVCLVLPLTVARAQPAAELLEAEARYRSAIAISPHIGAYHTSLGVVLQRLGRDEEALHHFTEATRLDPGSARAHGVLGEFLLQRGDDRGAAAVLERAAELDQRNASYALALGGIAARRDDWRQAARHYERAVALMPADERAAEQLREARAHAGIAVDAPVGVREDRPAPALRALERVFAVLFGGLLVVAALALAAPIAGALYLTLLLALQAARRQPRAS